MTDMLTEVARAICDKRAYLGRFDQLTEYRQNRWRYTAKAAIESLRESTDEMVWAVCNRSIRPGFEDGCHRCPATVDMGRHGDGTQACRLIAQEQIEALVVAALEGKND